MLSCTLVSLRQIPVQFIPLTLQTIGFLLQILHSYKFPVCSCLFHVQLYPSQQQTTVKRALLPLIKGMEWLQMGLCCVCGQLHAAVWRLHGCCCRCCCCGCCSIMSLWQWAAVSLADRQALALVTAASCHLGPCTERGGQGHANGRKRDKVINTLAYWLAYCLTDWLGFFFCLKTGLDRFSQVWVFF